MEFDEFSKELTGDEERLFNTFGKIKTAKMKKIRYERLMSSLLKMPTQNWQKMVVSFALRRIKIQMHGRHWSVQSFPLVLQFQEVGPFKPNRPQDSVHLLHPPRIFHLARLPQARSTGEGWDGTTVSWPRCVRTSRRSCGVLGCRDSRAGLCVGGDRPGDGGLQQVSSCEEGEQPDEDGVNCP